MSPRTFQDYVDLWREQIDEAELAELRVRAQAIAQTANRRRRLDVAGGAVVLCIIVAFLLLGPPPLLARLCFVPPTAAAAGFVWWRHRIAVDARAISVDHPHFFFESAIRNARSELNLSRFCLWLPLPTFVLTVGMAKAVRGIDPVAFFLGIPNQIGVVSIASLALLALGVGYFIRDHGKIRDHLRRLEAMRREWDDQSTR